MRLRRNGIDELLDGYNGTFQVFFPRKIDGDLAKVRSNQW